MYKAFVASHLTYDEWRKKVDAGDPALWSHLDKLERGIEGSFYQKLWAAMTVADLHHQRRIYEAVPYIFDNTSIFR
jgi:hypothetical protein